MRPVDQASGGFHFAPAARFDAAQLRRPSKISDSARCVQIYARKLDFAWGLRKFIRMTQAEKLLTKLKNEASDANWIFPDLVKLLNQHGFEEIRVKGSHRFYKSPDYPDPIILAPHGNKIKAGYIRKIRELLIE